MSSITKSIAGKKEGRRDGQPETEMAMMTLDKDTVGIWFVPINDSSDFAMTLHKETAGFVLAYRFRYYDKTEYDPFSGKDRKNSFRVSINDNDVERVLKTVVRGVLNEVEKLCGNLADEILMHDGDIDEFLKEMKTRSWAHMREMS